MSRRTLAFARFVRGHLVAGALVALAVTVSRAAQAVLLAHLLVRALSGAPVGALVPVAGWWCAVIVLRALLLWAGELIARRTADATTERLRDRLYRKLIELGPGYLADRRSGSVRATLTDGVETMETYFARFVPAWLNAVLGPITVLGYLATVSPQAALLALAGGVLSLVLPALVKAARTESNSRVWQNLGDLDAEYTETVQGLLTVKAFNAVARRRAVLAARADEVRAAVMKELRVNLTQVGFAKLGTVGGAAATLIWAVWSGAAGELGAAAVLAVLLVVREVYRPLEELGRYSHDAMGAADAVAGFEELLNARTATPEPEYPLGADVGGAVVQFEDVCYRYPGRDGHALRDVRFSIGEGETVAVVGSSGAGKSTLVHLLLRFADPDSGRIRVGERDLREFATGELRDLITVVSQDTYLFHGTIADNIALGRPGASEAEIRRAAEAAGVAGFIDELPGGYRTAVGERGTRLSGGQRQRIAIARAVLKDAPILVLDEATSNVDAAAEQGVQAALETVAANRTTLVIAHRLSTVRDADRIVVLDDGAIAEAGTHDQLRARGGRYAELLAAQFGAEVTGVLQ